MTHALRAAHNAILVGIGTILSDDPQLTVRLVDGVDPQPIVLDSKLRMPVDCRVMGHRKGVWVATASGDESKQRMLTANGARIIHVPTARGGRVDLCCLLARLGEMGVRSVMVEGGARVLSSFSAAGWPTPP